MEQSLSSGPVHFFGQDSSISASEFLLRNRRPGLAKRVLAKLGFRVHLGKFKPSGMTDYTSYFFVWCSHHKGYYVDYERGYDLEVICPNCEAVERERSKDREARNLRLVSEESFEESVDDLF